MNQTKEITKAQQATSTALDTVPEATAKAPVADRLAELEAVIGRGLDTFLEVGHALAAIRDNRLYRPEYGSFDDYLRARWQPHISRGHAYRLIQAAEIADNLSPIGVIPANEAQARELAPVSDQPELLREIAEAVREEHGVEATAADYREAVRKHTSVKRTVPVSSMRTAAGAMISAIRTAAREVNRVREHHAAEVTGQDVRELHEAAEQLDGAIARLKERVMEARKSLVLRVGPSAPSRTSAERERQ
jgi:hypothetical protein